MSYIFLYEVLDRKPLPLTTVELQKAGSRLLRLAPKKVLDVRTRRMKDDTKVLT
jgi:hypothetical protein